MRKIGLLVVVFMLCGCAQTKHFMSGITTPKSFELVDQNQHQFMSMSASRNGTQLSLDGTVRGRLIPSGDAPQSSKVVCAIGDAGWTDATMSGLDFNCTLKGQQELTSLPMNVPLKIKIAWEDELQSSGKAYRATPDTFDFDLKLDNSGRATLMQADQPAPSADVRATFAYAQDDGRLSIIEREHAEQERQDRAETITRQKEEELRAVVSQLYEREAAIGNQMMAERGIMGNLGSPRTSIEWLNPEMTNAKVTVDGRGLAQMGGVGYLDVIQFQKSKTGWKMKSQPQRTLYGSQ